MVVHLDDETGGAGGDKGKAHGRHQVPHAGRVRRVSDDGKMGELLHHGDGGAVQRVARRLLVCPDAAFAQHDLVSAVGHEVFGGHQPLLDGRGKPSLEEHGHSRLADLLEKLEVLHVARPDLEHVDVVGHHRDIAWGDDLCGDGHAEFITCLAQILQALLSEALE